MLVDLLHGRRAFLFDLGDISALSVREILRVRDVFVSHTHMDHFTGFDRLLRLQLGREAEIRLFGPEGLMAQVAHKLHAYTWNLVDGYETDLAFIVTEVLPGEEGRRCRFRLRHRFMPEDVETVALPGGVLLEEANLQARAAVLDHGIPCLGFAIQEKQHVNVFKNRLEEMGLERGPWLNELKRLVLADAPPEAPVTAYRRVGDEVAPLILPLAELRRSVLAVVPGDRLAYVTDVAWHAANVEAILALAAGAELLFIEAPFLDRDRERAAARRHLTARQAGELARLAGARRAVPFHFSPRHAEEEDLLRQEFEAAFAGP